MGGGGEGMVESGNKGRFTVLYMRRKEVWEGGERAVGSLL